MSTPYARAPHQGGGVPQGSGQHAALLIDFDNVTMGMRSDLSKDLKKLLQSDIIKGKVTVQRAYADWRRYPQYIVPLSEASIDLIFAPAYGSNKKNATDIRMAIDGMELVFTRPEIATFILLTGDSDFSSLVLKLKEYGKYVIGVGIQESSSDILVQNCDEYYSYTSLTGLRKTTDSDRSAVDPWVLVEKAVTRMAERDDVMRSDRLKQVMIEIDPNFDEGDFGYSKFSRFLSEAAGKRLVKLTKLENGQYEVGPAGGARGETRRRRDEAPVSRSPGAAERSREGRGRGGRDRPARTDRPERGERPPRSEDALREEPTEPSAAVPESSDGGAPARPQGGTSQDAGSGPLAAAYDLLRRSLETLREMGRDGVRDSDVKRKMLELDASFDETDLGFSKFSRFLRQAHDHEVVDLHKQEGGSYEVTLGGSRSGREAQLVRESAPASREATGATASEQLEVAPPPGPGLGPRRGSTRRRRDEPALPSLFEGQVANAPPIGERPASGAEAPVEPVAPAASGVDVEALGLPTDPEAQIRYLTNSYRGVGQKTAEALVERFGEELFTVLQNEPGRLERVVPHNRAEQLLEAWRADYQRRAAKGGGTPGEGVATGVEAPPEDDDGGVGATKSGRRTRRGGRRSGRDRTG